MPPNKHSAQNDTGSRRAAPDGRKPTAAGPGDARAEIGRGGAGKRRSSRGKDGSDQTEGDGTAAENQTDGASSGNSAGGSSVKRKRATAKSSGRKKAKRKSARKGTGKKGRTANRAGSTRATARSSSGRADRNGNSGTRKRSARRSNAGNGMSPLPVAALRWRCRPETLSVRSTEETGHVSQIVGQDNAVESLAFGLDSAGPGQNMFIRGLSGTGRSTMVRRLFDTIRPSCPPAKDCCYVHNFAEPERPRLIMFSPGQGQDFRHLMNRFADFIRDDLRGALSSEGVSARRSSLEQNTQKAIEEVVGPFEASLKEAGLTLVSVEAGPVIQSAIFPLVDGRAVAPEEFEQLHTRGEIPDEEYKAAREAFKRFEHQLSEINDRADEIRRAHSEASNKLMEEAGRSILLRFVRMIESAFPQAEVHAFMNELVDDVVTNRLEGMEEGHDYTGLYRVNVVLDHKSGERCPVIVEHAPTVRNLLGTVDYGAELGDGTQPRHMCIRPGSLLRADGGFLIIEDREILEEPEAWKGLKRALRTGRVQILPPETMMPGWSTSLKPEAIEINTKVLLIGDPDTYQLLDEHDPDFAQLFKVLVDFDSVLPRDDDGIRNYMTVIGNIVREENLPEFDRTAIASLIEHGARISAMAGKLTARFGRIADVAREAALLAEARDSRVVAGEDVREAVIRRKRRASLPSRRFRECVADGTIRIDTEGEVVGQVNGLAVLQAGPMVYGFPTRITAAIGPGTGGVINIEREASLSGSIHTKGFYILGGLMRRLLRPDHPLAFDASLAFEQSYGAIDGDSASGAETCCLISALTGIPLRQDLAMTGAIDQMGTILAVGAVDEKVEGFFDVCRDHGTLGTQGVIIPKANAPDLMLRHDVVEACERGEFRVYAVENVLEALELLTGRPAGTRLRNGKFAKGTVLAAAVERAHAYWIKATRPRTQRSRR